MTYTLYGTDHSYFTGKVRPYLRYKGLAYREKQATVRRYLRVIRPKTRVSFIPVLETGDGQFIQDTTDIIDFLEARHPGRSVYPAGPVQKLVALLFELYGDEWFLLPAMHYRWSHIGAQKREIMTAFGAVASPWLPGLLGRAAGAQLAKPFRGTLKPLGITPRTAGPIERWTEIFLAQFEAHLATHPYLLGSRPCIGDFALAGPIYAHLHHDPYPRKVLMEKVPGVCAWLDRINAAEQAEGDFLPDDAVPETLIPILTHLFAEHWPIITDTIARVGQWVVENPDRDKISRAIGTHRFTIGGIAEDRFVFPYAQWMAQRVLDHYKSMGNHADSLLAQCGAQGALDINLPVRLDRVHNKLTVRKEDHV